MGASFIVYSMGIVLAYVIYEILAIRLLFKDIDLNNREKIAWGIVFLLIPVISLLIFYLVKGMTNKSL